MATYNLAGSEINWYDLQSQTHSIKIPDNSPISLSTCYFIWDIWCQKFIYSGKLKFTFVPGRGGGRGGGRGTSYMDQCRLYSAVLTTPHLWPTNLFPPPPPHFHRIKILISISLDFGLLTIIFNRFWSFDPPPFFLKIFICFPLRWVSLAKI